ncbi:group II intron reverse transcriptase/maturase [Bacillus sp. FJAT-44742]|uniref:group II intron reverse transcriptase/maturase n=1 Tax=Bacillus sp. FJAT-44742 TaxID=2014005 RepID=UPI000C24A29A|nr:group II intron reverse transcriptase/maturase [Bacillus sp. FJAT-44742]
MQTTLDHLYQQSQNGDNFYKLIELMKMDENIRLAYRNIKKNMGSTTAGTDGKTVNDIKMLPIEEVIEKVKSMFAWYQPQAVRRVFIPKPNGDQRPLGIPTIWDRLFQQCILQILEPICEAKFHPHSYGFRPNRSTHHALARMKSLVNSQGKGFHYCVDMDIKGFFDNVHHGKLLKQIWSLGIRDKKLISIISRLIKAEIVNEGFSQKGTPQGGILSPLLSNIVLNELDWWISDQWETIETAHPYKSRNDKYKALKKSRLKECFLIRYADDFKILCRNYSTALKVFEATKKFLRIRLHLDISTKKSKVINLRKKSSDFLGFTIKARKKRNRHVAHSRMCRKARNNAYNKLKKAIKDIRKKQTPESVWHYNTVVMGIQNYYSAATHIIKDLDHMSNHLIRTLYNRLRQDWTKATKHDMSTTLKKRYRNYNPKLYKIQGIVLIPIHASKHKPARNFTQSISNYTVEGRGKIHDTLKAIDKETLRHVQRYYMNHRTIEYNDNRISKFIAQFGKCAITKQELSLTGWHCHHKIPLEFGGQDNFDNLIIVLKDIHLAVHHGDSVKAKSILKSYEIAEEKKGLFDKLRTLAQRSPIFS